MISSKKHNYRIDVMSLKPGDKLVVRTLEYIEGHYINDDNTGSYRSFRCGSNSFVEEMFGFCGKTVTFKKYTSWSKQSAVEINIEEDKGYYNWTPEMFEDLETN